MRILFVCMGNICRSPLAEGAMRYWLKHEWLEHLVEVDSAGTSGGHEGDAPDKRAQAVAVRRGYDISGLRARRVQQSDFERFDLILAMDKDNLETLRLACPLLYQDKLALFLSYGPKSLLEGRDEVPDPYYGGPQGFDRVLDLVEDAVGGLIVSIRDDKPL